MRGRSGLTLMAGEQRKSFCLRTMFTSEMESMLAMLMLIPTMTGGPEENRGRAAVNGRENTE